MEQQMINYEDNELTSIMERCLQNITDINKDTTEMTRIHPELDEDLYQLFWIDPNFDRETDNEYTDHCGTATDIEILQEAARLINKELKRRGYERASIK